ncbi:hypothetical protein UPYG_G00125310 [Umbra pygmaea]|uniref:Uncharacterized protein n=1 Tax=Umbra pygmaea TaxID=75934 RepID=A0ABD0XVE8_UMBPY
MEYPGAILEDLKRFVVNDAPPTVYYIPDFITENEEEHLLQQVYKATKTKWTQLSNRRLQNWGGLPQPKGMLGEKLPDWLQKYCERISALGAFEGKTANHVLVNEYKPGEGIMPHEDGPLYHPTVTTISLGSHTLLDFYRPISAQETEEAPQTEENRYLLSLLVQPRSLLILQDDMYQRLLHGIQGTHQDLVTDRVANLSTAGSKAGDLLTRGTRAPGLVDIFNCLKMFMAKRLIGGLIDVVSNIDPGAFMPTDPPAPRRPLAYAEQNESDEERQFRKVFQQLAGDDMEVSPNELMNILNKIISKHCDLKTDGFSIESCRSMVSVMDSDSTGKLGFYEFKHLWNNIKKWQAVYKTHDTDRSGVIGADELPAAFRAAGFPLNDQLFQMIIRRYSDDNGNMDFDNYIGCLVRLDAMCRAFKTLDKDNNGTIKVNVKEWLQLTMYS